MKGFYILIFLISVSSFSNAQITADSSVTIKDSVVVKSEPAKAPSKKWFEKISIRGYTQVRYNRLLETNPNLKCEQCDRSWGENGGLFLRRIRLVFFGQIHDRVYFYIQPDFASSASSTSLNFGQLRDAYFDLALDKKQEFRLRVGQSKIPFGFENLQSSQNRIPLDRADGLNSAFANERDIAAFFYWAPSKIRARFSQLVSSGLKGSGDYGVVGLGIFNGQTANRPDANNTLHTVARISYPFLLKSGQFIEAGIQAYTGQVVVTSTTKGVSGKNNFEYTDERIAASFIIYPQPFGLQAEYNIGRGPEYDPETNSIVSKNLNGGSALMTYMFNIKDQYIIPFARYHFYDGGKKHETDARRYSVREFELGVEWQPIKYFELVAMYTISDRTFDDGTQYVDGVFSENRQKGNLLRLQVQFNY